MDGYKTHVFVCTNSPEKSGKCGSKGAEKLRKELKEKCRDEFGKSIRINSAGCLGYCEKGIAAVIYPEGKWLFDLEKDDSEKLLKEIRKSHQSSTENK